MNVILCQNRFEPLILALRKIHTIRAHRKDGRPRARIGETVSLRIWTGKPYRSKQREFATATVKYYFPVTIDRRGVKMKIYRMRNGRYSLIRSRRLSRIKIAKNDGFANWPEMRTWFEKAHGLPFKGVLIHWENLKPTPATYDLALVRNKNGTLEWKD